MRSVKLSIEWPLYCVELNILRVDDLDPRCTQTWEPVFEDRSSNPQWVHHRCSNDSCVPRMHEIESAFQNRTEFNHHCMLVLLRWEQRARLGIQLLQ